MIKKLVVGSMVFLMVCFLLLGGIFFTLSKSHEGTAIRTGYYSGDTFVPITSGTIGGNSSKMKQLKAWGTGCFILSGLCGFTGIVVKIMYKD